MTVNLKCSVGTHTLVSCSSKENDTLHKSLVIHLEKSKHSLFYYMYGAKSPLKSLYSSINYIHEQYIYFICTIQVMYIYSKCIQYSMNTTQQKRKCSKTIMGADGFCFGTGYCIGCGKDFD